MDLVTLIVILFVLVLVGLAFLLVRIGMRTARDIDPLSERLAEFAERGETVTLEDVEMSQPFYERVVVPVAQKLGEVAEKFTPQALIEDTSVKIEMAGNPRGLDPTIFLASRFGVALLMAALLAIVFSAAGANNPAFRLGSLRSFLFMGVFAVLGFFIPGLLLQSRITRRQKSIRKSMPDALDLLTICVEAGLGFDQALTRVHEKWDDDLSLSFGRALREMALGKLRREALRAMSDRIGISEMTSFIAAVIQSEQLGVSMAKVLRIQSDNMRIKRRQAAEEEAQKAPIKMLFPMAILIFPSIMVILLGPAGLILLQSALGEMLFG